MSMVEDIKVTKQALATKQVLIQISSNNAEM